MTRPRSPWFVLVWWLMLLAMVSLLAGIVWVLSGAPDLTGSRPAQTMPTFNGSHER